MTHFSKCIANFVHITHLKQVIIYKQSKQFSRGETYCKQHVMTKG